MPELVSKIRMPLWLLRSMVLKLLAVYIQTFAQSDLYYMSKFEKGDEEQQTYSAFFRKCADATASTFSTI